MKKTIKTITVNPASSACTMGAAIAGELYKNGEVELITAEEGAICQVFSSFGVAKDCMADICPIEIVSATIRGTNGSFIIKTKRS